MLQYKCHHLLLKHMPISCTKKYAFLQQPQIAGVSGLYNRLSRLPIDATTNSISLPLTLLAAPLD